MGQVPGIIGDGRMAKNILHYFSLLGVNCANWSRRLQASQGITLEQSLSGCSVILLAITDSAIEPFIQEHRDFFTGKTVVHFSGSLVTPLARGFHPLMTFTPTPYCRAVYETIPFVCEEGGATHFRELFPFLKNPTYEIRAEIKPLYHALCVLSGNFTALLWRKVFDDFENRLGLPREVTFPYLGQLFENLANEAESAFTGPIARKDRVTIEKNLTALQGDAFHEVYVAFAKTQGVEV